MMQEQLTEEQLNEELVWQMPEVCVGQEVVWYEHGTPGKKSECATVYRVAGRNVHLRTATKGVKEAVRHVNDPKLRWNAEQREMGAWDYPEWWKEYAERFTALHDRLTKVEQSLARMTIQAATENAPARRPKLVEYHDLRRRVVAAGVDVQGNPPTEWLEQKLQEVNDGEVSSE